MSFDSASPARMPRFCESEDDAPGNTLDYEDVALLTDLLGHPAANVIPGELVVDRRTDGVRRCQIAREGKRRDALVIGIFHGLVQRRGIRATDDDRIDALVDQLPHLLDLRGILQVRLGDDDVLHQTQLLPFRKHLSEEPLGRVLAPRVARIGARVADRPRWRLGRLEVLEEAWAHRLRRVHEFRIVNLVSDGSGDFIQAGRAHRGAYQHGAHHGPKPDP